MVCSGQAREDTSREMKHLLDFLINIGYLQSTERVGRATNSEIRRWFERDSVEVNGERAKWDDPVPAARESLVLHPKSKRRTTLW